MDKRNWALTELCVRNIKNSVYHFVDNLGDISDMERSKLAQNIALNLICQITQEMAIPALPMINEGFDELLLDIDIWRKSYLENNPKKYLKA